jgi:hypothetical protein
VNRCVSVRIRAVPSNSIVRNQPRTLRFTFLLVAAMTALARAQAPAPTDPADAAAIGTSLPPALLRDLPASANLFSLLETTEG